jgi:predicted phosphodiesterase
MRILIISDIHANLTALEAVLVDAGQVDAVWCLGDLVGYGPDPTECVERVRSLRNLQCIIGNHDAATLNQIDSESFNPEARQAIRWTQEALSEGAMNFLRALPERLDLDGVTLVHGSPRHPVWEYLLDTQNATRSFEHFESPYCFVGHTHLPSIYYMGENNHSARLLVPEANTHFMLSPRAILNPGSVGQPRDRDSRAAYAVYLPEEQVWEYYRVPYDIADVQARMKTAGLPDRHIQRLSAGW